MGNRDIKKSSPCVMIKGVVPTGNTTFVELEGIAWRIYSVDFIADENNTERAN